MFYVKCTFLEGDWIEAEEKQQTAAWQEREKEKKRPQLEEWEEMEIKSVMERYPFNKVLRLFQMVIPLYRMNTVSTYHGFYMVFKVLQRIS